MILDSAQRVVFVPGYGMAVAQAQHAVRDVANLLEKTRGRASSTRSIPVAGRMPGHMNVLLAEADVPYDKLKEMDEINPTMETVDVAIVIGANDVVNPLARTDPQEPDCRDADHRRRQGAHRDRDQTQPQSRIRRNSQSAVCVPKTR